jgi:predicted enzyme related to lactoylglutathione lyase
MADTFVHFEIPADDPAKLKKFYSGAFGWSFQESPMPGNPGAGPYILVMTTEPGKPGMNGGMYKRNDKKDKPKSYLGVADIEKTLKKVTSSGGAIVSPKMPIPGVGWFAIVKDPEGNEQGVFQDDQKAA